MPPCPGARRSHRKPLICKGFKTRIICDILTSVPDKRHAVWQYFMTRPSLGPLLFFAIAFALSLYFTFAAVQGDFGLFRRAEIVAETNDLQRQLDAVNAQVAQMENLTKRLSDDYLDLDLLDERARKVLGFVRADEIVIR